MRIEIEEPAKEDLVWVRYSDLKPNSVFTTESDPHSRWVAAIDGCLLLIGCNGRKLDKLLIFTPDDIQEDSKFQRCRVVPDCKITCTFGAD